MTVGANLLNVITLIAALCLLLLAMRWAFRSSHRMSGRPVDAADSTELGMLRVISSRVPRAEATRILALLTDAGIQASFSRRRDGNVDVLVFYDDAARAQAVLGR
jgi:hypothetical protein